MGIIYRKSIASEISIKEITQPLTTVVTLAEQKLFSRIDGSLEDALITMMIKSATKQAEKYVRGGFITRTYTQTEDAGDYQNQDLIGSIKSWFWESFGFERAIEIKNILVSSIQNFKVYDIDGNETIVDPSLYRLDRADSLMPARLVFESDELLFNNSRYFTQYKIEYTAGWANAGAVPDDIKMAVMSIAQGLYEDRETMEGLSPKVDMLLGTYRILEV